MQKSPTLSHLLSSFREALIAVQPVAEEIGIAWREPDNYDEWDTIAGGLFDGFVRLALQASQELQDGMPIPSYDVRLNTYSGHSYVACKFSEGEFAPFVCLETSKFPFDSCLVAILDEELELISYKRLLFSECEFAVVVCSVSGRRGLLNVSY